MKILGLDPQRERAQLGLTQMQPKPWDLAPEKYAPGAVVNGKVVRITTFGAFVELEPGIDGLVHISQCAPTRINKVEDAVNIGDEIQVKVLSVDPEAKRISLSIRALVEPEVYEETQPVEDGEEAVAVNIEAVGAQLEAEASAKEAAQQVVKQPVEAAESYGICGTTCGQPEEAPLRRPNMRQGVHPPRETKTSRALGQGSFSILASDYFDPPASCEDFPQAFGVGGRAMPYSVMMA